MADSHLTEVTNVQAADLLRLRFLHTVAISPDGARVAFTIMQPNGETNRNDFSLWIVPTAGGEPRVVVDREQQDLAPAWSPDGSALAFVRRVGEASQIHLVDVDVDVDGDRPARQLTQDAARAASAPIWSPDGTQILFLARVPALPEPAFPRAFPAGATVPKVIARRRYKFDGMGWFDHRRQQLHVVSVAGGDERQLTHDEVGVGHPVWTAERGVPVGKPAWSPDGRRIAFVMSRDEEDDGPCDVWTLDLETEQLVRITPHDGLYGAPAWSPDGTRLVVVGTPFPRTVGYVNRLWSVPSTGGEMTPITGTELAIASGILADNGAPAQTQPVWGRGGVYCLVADAGTAQVWRVDPNTSTPRAVTRGSHAISSWSIAGDGSMLAFNASTPTNPGEVFVQQLDRPGSPARQLTELNADVLSGVSLGAVEEFWTTPDAGQARVQGWIITPPGFVPDGRYPLILQIHGGPTALYGWSWWHEFQMLAGHGFVVVAPNPRGSAGYGQEFATAIYRDWCDGPTHDLLAAVDHVIAQGSVDPERLYITGGSYGGYLVNWITTQTDRFRAGVTGRCVSDLRTLVLVDDIGSILAEHFGGMPWDDPELYAYQSPITHVARCRTPLLIEHQEADHRCPIDQAEQLYNALRILGVAVEMVLYPNESHSMSRNGAPLNRVDRLLRMVDWFERNG